MKKSVYELRNNKRVQALHGKTAAPGNVMTQRKKSFSLRVVCAADYPHRVVKLENLQHELLQNKLYSNMTPQNLFSGDFEVTEGYEEQFKEIAQEHGFRAMEVRVCE